MRCRDIADEDVIAAVKATPGYCRMWSQVWPVFDAAMPGVPYNVFVAKVRRLAHRGLLHACVHGGKAQCRGDLHLPEECKGC